MSVANIVNDHQEYFCVEKVVWKKGTGKSPALLTITSFWSLHFGVTDKNRTVRKKTERLFYLFIYLL